MPKRKIKVNLEEVRKDGLSGLEKLKKTNANLQDSKAYKLLSKENKTENDLQEIEKLKEGDGRKYRQALVEKESIEGINAKLSASEKTLEKNLKDEKKVKNYVYAKQLLEEERERKNIELSMIAKFKDKIPNPSQPLPRISLHGFKVGNDPDTQKYNEEYYLKYTDPEANHACVQDLIDKFMKIDFSEVEKAVNGGDETLLTYYDEHREELEFAFNIHAFVRDLNNASNLGKHGNTFEFTKEFLEFYDNCSGFVESLSYVKSRVQLLGTEEYIASEGIDKLSDNESYTLAMPHLMANMGDKQAEAFSQLLMGSHSNTICEIIDKMKERGLKLDGNSIFKYGAYVEKEGKMQQVNMLTALRGENKDAVIIERPIEEAEKIRTVSTDKEKEELSKQSVIYKDKVRLREIAPLTDKMADYAKSVDKNSMFFKFMQSGEYSRFEKAFSDLNKKLKKNAPVSEIEESLKKLKTCTKKYLDYKGEPPAKDKRGIRRVECLKALYEDLEKIGVKEDNPVLENSTEVKPVENVTANEKLNDGIVRENVESLEKDTAEIVEEVDNAFVEEVSQNKEEYREP